MVIECYLTSASGLRDKGVEAVVDCPVEEYSFKTLGDLTWLVRELAKKMKLAGHIVFESNEPVGATHILYKYRILVEDKYVGVRVVSTSNCAFRVLFTIPSRELMPEVKFKEYSVLKDLRESRSERASRRPPGQYYVPNLVVYAVMGLPGNIDVHKWKLEVGGEVENKLDLSLSDLYSLGLKTIKADFHCVTGWSVEEVEFAGTPLRAIVEKARPREEAKWIYVECLDGYSTVMPASEAIAETALIAVEMNGKILEVEHGYPARLVIPRLYGWKSAKWISRILFTREYRDGYWEALGYHPRGRVDLEERFKRS